MRLSVFGLGIALVGCSIDTGFDPPPPPAWGVPLTGGTMTVTRDGDRVVVADPDRDRVVVVDLTTERVEQTIQLAARSEPGRVIDDGAGRIHVALRGSGELLTITGGDYQLRSVCAEPRGLAWEQTTDLVHVACATGELVSLPPGGGDPTRVLYLERDLRDVLVRDTGLVVTKFRTAEMLTVDTQGLIVKRVTPPLTQRADFEFGSQIPAVPSVAWRTIALPNGGMMMSHQRRLGTVLRVITGGYGGGMCNSSAVESALTIVNPDGTLLAVAPMVSGGVPVDVAVHPITGDVAVVSAGKESVTFIASASTKNPDQGGCRPPDDGQGSSQLVGFQTGIPSSVAYRPNGALLIYYPEADGITIVDGALPRGISLGARPMTDAGRALFHRQTSSGLACASCHPEGRDDGGVWKFDTLGMRRTQNLGGGILSRAPYHWGADMTNLHVLLEDVFTNRMAGDPVSKEEDAALGQWLDRIAAPKGVIRDYEAVARGEAIFSSSETGCKTCHGGALLTNNSVANVGTSAMFKVPSLIGVGGRAPFMHDGCAATLRDRFGYCGGGEQHGHTSHLTAEQLGDLIAYLESL